MTREDEVLKARKAAEEKLAEAKELEKQWQAKQAEMDLALKVIYPVAQIDMINTLAILSTCIIFKVRTTVY